MRRIGLLPRLGATRISGGVLLRRSTWPALCLLLLAWLLHWRAFGLAELGADGALSVDLAHRPIMAMLAFTAGDVHPPLFYLLLHGMFDLAGLQYFTAKFLPIASGMLALVALASLGDRLAGRGVGLLAAALFLISPADITLASTVRDYMPGLACSLLTLLLTDRLRVAGTPRGVARRGCFLLAAMTAVALLTWYFHVIFLVTEGALLFGRSYTGRQRRWVGWSLGAGILVAFPWYAAVAPGLLRLLTSGATAFDGAATLPPLSEAVRTAVMVTTGVGGWLGAVALVSWVVALVLGVRGGLRKPLVPAVDAHSRWDGLLAGLVLGGGAALVPALRWATLGALDRYILVILPFVVLMQAVALRAARRSWRMVAGIALASVILAQSTGYVALVRGGVLAYTDDATFAYLAGHARPGDVLLFTDPQRRARYLVSGGTLPTAVIEAAAAHYLLTSPQAARATVAALVPRYQRIWYVESSVRPDAATLARAPLAAQAVLVEQHTFTSVNPGVGQFLATTLQLYLTRSPGPERVIDATLGGRITLDAAAFSPRVLPGAPLLVDLRWRADRSPGADYTVFVHLDDTAGQLVAQHDGPPANGLQPTGAWEPGALVDDRRAIALPPALPPGQYRLDAGLYRGSQRLALPDGTTTITLGMVQVG